VLPSPKSQLQVVGEPVEVSVNATGRGASPDRGVPVKSAVICLVTVSVTDAFVATCPSGLVTTTFQVPAAVWAGIVRTSDVPVPLMAARGTSGQPAWMSLTAGTPVVLKAVPVIVTCVAVAFVTDDGLIPVTTGAGAGVVTENTYACPASAVVPDVAHAAPRSAFVPCSAIDHPKPS